jgi:hypothetical protein
MRKPTCNCKVADIHRVSYSEHFKLYYTGKPHHQSNSGEHGSLTALHSPPPTLPRFSVPSLLKYSRNRTPKLVQGPPI